MRAGRYHPKWDFFGWVRVVGVQITRVPGLHSDEVPGASVPGILSVYSLWSGHDLRYEWAAPLARGVRGHFLRAHHRQPSPLCGRVRTRAQGRCGVR